LVLFAFGLRVMSLGGEMGDCDWRAEWGRATGKRGVRANRPGGRMERKFMTRIVAILFLLTSLAFTVSAQSEGDLKSYFEGKSVTFRIDMPASTEGVNVYPERGQSLDYNEYNQRLKKNGVSIRRSEAATITQVKVKNNHIEVQFADRSRFNIHFARVESWMLTPASLVDALTRYIEFTEADKTSARLQESSTYAAGYVRNGVVHVGPRTTYLEKGLKTEEVVKLLGEPLSVSERTESGKTVSTYEFQRGEGRVVIAEFVGNALVRSRTETRTTGAVAVLAVVKQ